MDISRIGAQLYTVRNFCKDEVGLAESLKKISDIGYRSVQVSGVGPIPVDKISEMLNENGLVCAATHEDFNRIKQETEKVIEEHRTLGCTHIVIPSMPGTYREGGEEGFVQFAKEMTEIGKRLKEEGLVLSYHNHSFEFCRFGSRTGFDILVKETDPEVVFFEPDTYWLQHGGVEPSTILRSLGKRVPLLHLKDMVIEGNTQIMAEVGEGNLNWKGILEAADECGVEWALVEQDTCKGDPFDSLRRSFENLNRILA